MKVTGTQILDTTTKNPGFNDKSSAVSTASNGGNNVDTLVKTDDNSNGSKKIGDYNRQDVERALDKVHKSIDIFNKRLHFKIDDKTKQIQVQIIDNDTGDVIGEIPPKKLLDLLASIQEITGLLFDKKA